MQNEKNKLREQLANAFAEERRKADEQRLQFEEEKLRGNELRQILKRQMLEVHQLRQEQRVRYERQRIQHATSEQQQRKTLFDSSSDDEDVQVARRGSTAFLFAVTAENTRSQAPADVAEGEHEVGSPTALAGNQRRSSAGGELSDPSNASVSIPSAKGTSS